MDDTDDIYAAQAVLDVSPTLHTEELLAISIAHQSPEQNTILNQSGSLRTSKRTHSDLFGSPSILNTTLSPILSISPSWPFSTAHEARLFHYYIKVCAPWIDTLDPLQHFGREVPRRVPYYPMIANAILALASRHMSMTNSEQDTESMKYADKCLEMLIRSMDDPFAHWDENLLAAVVILRLHEELSHGKTFSPIRSKANIPR